VEPAGVEPAERRKTWEVKTAARPVRFRFRGRAPAVLRKLVLGAGRAAPRAQGLSPGAATLSRRCPDSPLSKTVFCAAETSTFCRFRAILKVAYIVNH